MSETTTTTTQAVCSETHCAGTAGDFAPMCDACYSAQCGGYLPKRRAELEAKPEWRYRVTVWIGSECFFGNGTTIEQAAENFGDAIAATQYAMRNLRLKKAELREYRTPEVITDAAVDWHAIIKDRMAIKAIDQLEWLRAYVFASGRPPAKLEPIQKALDSIETIAYSDFID